MSGSVDLGDYRRFIGILLRGYGVYYSGFVVGFRSGVVLELGFF